MITQTKIPGSQEEKLGGKSLVTQAAIIDELLRRGAAYTQI